MLTAPGRMALMPVGRDFTQLRLCAVLPTSLCAVGVRELASLLAATGPLRVALSVGSPSPEWFDYWCDALMATPEGHVEICFGLPPQSRTGRGRR
jgi:hypothetical protein